jgi:Autotransporter beta-domain
MKKDIGHRYSRKGIRTLLLSGSVFATMALFSGEASASCTASGSLKTAVIWSGPVVCSAADSIAGITALNNSLAIDFFTFASPFVTSGPGAQPDSVQSGAWIRGVGGQSTTTTNFSASYAGFSLQGASKLTTDFSGVQGGIDTGRLNLGGSGWNVHFGLTFGGAWASPELGAASGSESASNPFLGVYAVFTKDNFFAHLQIRHGWQTTDISNGDLGLFGAQMTGNSWDFSGATGYRFNFDRFFVEPSGGFDITTEQINDLYVPGTPGGAAPSVPQGVAAFNQIHTSLGFLGARIGTDFATANLAVQPYVTGSIWRQFDGNINAQYCVFSCIPSPLFPNIASASLSQIGTFGQVGAGVAAQVLNTGLVGYVRGDYRTGDRYEGWALSGGFRYSF